MNIQHNTDISQMKRFIANTLLDKNALDDKWIQILVVESLFELAEHHDPSAYIIIGDFHRTGLEPWFPVDIRKAVKYYIKAIKAGVLFGYECIGMLFFYRGESNDDYRRVLNFFLSVVTHGGKLSFGGNYALAEMYRQGLYVEKNIGKAKRYYEKIVMSDVEYREMDEYYSLAQKQYKKLLNKKRFHNDQ